jgi:hypothetical protein
MVLTRIINPTKIFLFTAFLFCFACEDQGLIVKCPDCLSDEPEETEVDIKFDGYFSKNPVIFNLYVGNLEDSVLIDTYKITSSMFVPTVTLNKKYTFTATYTSQSGIRYIAVDSFYPKVKYEKDQCDDPCFFIYGKSVDLRLKYLK